MSDSPLQRKIEERANVWSQMTEVIDGADGRDLTGEERSKYDAAEKDLDRLTGEIELLERHASRAAAFEKVDRSNVPGTTPAITYRSNVASDAEAEYRSAFVAYLRGGVEELDNDQRKLLRSGWESLESRAQAVGTNSAGGYTVPTGFRQKFVERMKDYGAVQNVATVITTDSGQALPWPTNDDTGNVGALLAENTQVAEQDFTIGTAQLDAYKYTSKLTRVSLELLQDSAFDIEAWVPRKHGERVGRILNQHLTTGTGSSQPNGIVTGATSGVTAAGVAAITADEIIDLVHSVDPAYRTNGKFMLSDTALKVIRKLKDSTGQYLWQPNVQGGVAASLFGYPYVVNQDMAVPATGVKSVLFGDFEAGYVVRMVRAIQSVRFAERYMDYFQVGFVSFCRADGDVQDSYAYRALTQA
jgi:HK97 family phage major capsid protein